MNRFWSILFLLVPVLGVASCVMAAFDVWPMKNLWLPENWSRQGETIDSLSDWAHVLCGVILGGTGLMLAWNVWRYREDLDGKAAHVHHHRGLEVSWTLVPAAILVILALYQFKSWEENRLQRPIVKVGGDEVTQPPHALIYARRFGWEIHYPGADGLPGTPDDFYLENLLVVPSDEPVVLQLQSYDVIHSFFVPNLRVKHDIVPGMPQFTWFEAIRTGECEFYCAELCGWGHTTMRGQLRILSRSDYDAWLKAEIDRNLPEFAVPQEEGSDATSAEESND